VKQLSKNCSQRKHYLEINNLQTCFCVLYVNLATVQIVCLKPKKLFEKTGTSQWLKTLLLLISSEVWMCKSQEKLLCFAVCSRWRDFSVAWFFVKLVWQNSEDKKWYKLKSGWVKKKCVRAIVRNYSSTITST